MLDKLIPKIAIFDYKNYVFCLVWISYFVFGFYAHEEFTSLSKISLISYIPLLLITSILFSNVTTTVLTTSFIFIYKNILWCFNKICFFFKVRSYNASDFNDEELAILKLFYNTDFTPASLLRTYPAIRQLSVKGLIEKNLDCVIIANAHSVNYSSYEMTILGRKIVNKLQDDFSNLDTQCFLEFINSISETPVYLHKPSVLRRT